MTYIYYQLLQSNGLTIRSLPFFYVLCNLTTNKYAQKAVNPFMPTGAFIICCPRDCVSA